MIGRGLRPVPCRRLVLIAALLVAAFPGARLAAAQGGPARLPTPGSRAGLSDGGGASGASLPAVTVAPAVVVDGSPRSFSVASVAVPEEMPRGRRVEWEVDASDDGAVLGRTRGVLPAADRRPVLLTVSVRSGMRAGLLEIARVRFTAAPAVVVVPILVAVAAEHEVQVAFVGGDRVVPPDSTLALAYRVTNLGNAADTVEVRVVVPAGWTLLDDGAPGAVVLAVHASVQRTLRLRATAGGGSGSVRLVVMARGAPVATTETTVEVLPSRGTGGAAGPVLTLGTGVAAGPWSGNATAAVAQLEGPLTDGIAISARAATVGGAGSGATYAFSRAGLSTMAPTVSLFSPQWRASLGVTGVALTDLTGTNVSGRGAAVSASLGHLGATVVAARPDLGETRVPGAYTGLRVESRNDEASLSLALAHLREDRDISRQLDAIALGAGLDHVGGGTWQGEVARRRFALGSAFGWSTSFVRRTPADAVQLRYTHAPGGSGAFARATEDFAASASRDVGRRLALTGSLWHSFDDGSTTFSGLTVEGWSLESRLDVGPQVDFSLGARGTGFLARTAAAEFGSGERAVEGGVVARVGSVAVQGMATASDLTRRTTLEAGDLLVQRAPRRSLRGTLSTGGSSGTIGVTGQYDEAGPGVGMPARQWLYGVRMDRLSFGAERPRAFVTASLERVGGSGDGTMPVTLFGSVEIPMGARSALTISAERNPYLFAGTGGQWMYMVNVTRSAGLGRVARRVTRGVVFKDLNANGERDAGEPGFAGVIVRRGADVAETDARGVFTFDGETGEAMELDTRSFPIGWLASSPQLRPGQDAVGVVAVSAVEVHVTVAEGDSARVSNADVESVDVVARDESGRAWVARRASRELAVFDALPPGTYSLDVDLSGATEPLRLDGAVPSVHVVAGRPVAPIRIVLRARALRFAPPPA